MLIAIEGIDGSGKGTQAARLQSYFQQQGRRATVLSFPRYQQTAFGRQIGDFLNGRFGSLAEVHPLLVSLLFAGDRFESRELIQQAIAEHDLVICDRYVASNIAHQGAKVAPAQRAELVAWIEQLEYSIYKLPVAQLTLFLDVPVAQAQQLIAAKAKRSYTDQSADLQEADAAYLQQVRDMYHHLAGGPGWTQIQCVSGAQLRPLDEITAEMISVISTIEAASRPAG